LIQENTRRKEYWVIGKNKNIKLESIANSKRPIMEITIQLPTMSRLESVKVGKGRGSGFTRAQEVKVHKSK
jgi:hypothetical protein